MADCKSLTKCFRIANPKERGESASKKDASGERSFNTVANTTNTVADLALSANELQNPEHYATKSAPAKMPQYGAATQTLKGISNVTTYGIPAIGIAASFALDMYENNGQVNRSTVLDGMVNGGAMLASSFGGPIGATAGGVVALTWSLARMTVLPNSLFDGKPKEK